MHALTELWWQLYVNRTDGTLRAYQRGWIFSPAELRREEVSRALEGRQSLGVYAVDPQGRSRWVCLDADTLAGGEYLLSVAQTRDPASSLLELSRRGAYLWLFCPATEWQRAREVGLALVEQSPEPIEVFPKGAGRNGVRLPLTPHPRTGETYPVVDPYTGEIRQEQGLTRLRPVPLPALRPQLAKEMVTRRSGHWERTSYTELYRAVEQYTTLREYAPERALGRCPFHDDRHPSLSLLGGFWRCWTGCGQGGLYAFRRLAQERGMEVKNHAIYTTK